MNIEDYEIYHQKGGTYVIPVEVFNDLLEENQELKIQLEEYKHHLKCAKEMLDIQGQNGNYNYDNYMLGLYNGMEYIISLFETREPIYRNGNDIEFLSDKNQQKEYKQEKQEWINLLNMFKNQQKKFIDYMNKTIEELECDDVDDEELKGYLLQRIDTFKEILSKYKSILGEHNG